MMIFLLTLVWCYAALATTIYLVRKDEESGIGSNFTEAEVLAIPAIMLIVWPVMLYTSRHFE